MEEDALLVRNYILLVQHPFVVSDLEMTMLRPTAWFFCPVPEQIL